jgi:hypothetical protein
MVQRKVLPSKRGELLTQRYSLKTRKALNLNYTAVWTANLAVTVLLVSNLSKLVKNRQNDAIK